jgi:hypothetical protein
VIAERFSLRAGMLCVPFLILLVAGSTIMGLPTPVFAQSLIPNDLQRTPPGQFDKYPTISVLGRTKRTEGELSRKEQLCSMQRSKINTIQPSSRKMEVTTGRYKGLSLSCSSLARW